MPQEHHSLGSNPRSSTTTSRTRWAQESFVRIPRWVRLPGTAQRSQTWLRTVMNRWERHWYGAGATCVSSPMAEAAV